VYVVVDSTQFILHTVYTYKAIYTIYSRGALVGTGNAKYYSLVYTLQLTFKVGVSSVFECYLANVIQWEGDRGKANC
jgi:hypothetical protein